MGWASGHAIDVFEDGMLVHPTLGKAFLARSVNAKLIASQGLRILVALEMTGHSLLQVMQADNHDSYSMNRIRVWLGL